jgi:hypothetical protein
VDGFSIDTNQAVGHVSGQGAETADRGIARAGGIRPSIRPVVVDESGRIFEVTGEQICMPGLEPQAILDSIEDERAGRTHSLKEIIASRKQHGIRDQAHDQGEA